MSHAYDLATRIDRLMRRLHAGVHARAPKFDPEKVGPLGGMVLMAISDDQPISIQALTRHMARDKAQMTRLVQTLERKGFLEREVSGADARVSLLTLTQKGEDFVTVIKSTVAEVLDEVLGSVTVDERDQLMRILGKV